MYTQKKYLRNNSSMDIELQESDVVNSSSSNASLPKASAVLSKKPLSNLHIVSLASVSISLVAIALAIYFGVSLDNCRKDSSENWDNQTPVEWIKNNAYNISSVETTANDDFSDLAFLSDILKDVDVLWLGETNHGDGSIHTMRTRIIKYLHQCCGFNTLSLEAPLFDSLAAYTEVVNLTDATRTDENVAAIFKKNIVPYWGDVEETQELFRYIADMAHTENPLEFTGYDSQGNFDGRMFADLKKFLEFSLAPENLPNTMHFEILEKVIEYNYWFIDPLPSQEDIDDFFNTVKTTHDLLVNSVPSEDNPYKLVYQTWTQIYNTTYSLGRDSLVDGPGCGYTFPCSSVDFTLNNRHYQMSENVLWQMRTSDSLVGITNRKIIIWTHNVHSARNMNSFPDPTYQTTMCKLKTSPCGVETAGHRIKIALGDRSYSLVTMASSGTIGSNSCPPNTDGGGDIHAPVGYLEYYMRLTGFPAAALVDFATPIPAWLRDVHFIGYDEYEPNQGDLPNIYDGLLYLDTMDPITCL